MKKVIIPVFVTILALAGIFFVLTKNKANNEAQTAIVAQKNNSVTVRTDVADYKDLDRAYVTNGVFAPKQEVKISAETPGRVTRVLVSEGAQVKAGQVLAIIESDKQNVSLSNAQAVYNNAKAEVERFENAFATGGVTRQQLDQVKLQLENAKNNLKSAELTASDVNVRASFPGVVNSRKVEPGKYVNPGEELFEIVNLSSLKLKVNVDEKNISAVKMGQKIKVVSPVLPDESWTGVVTFIAPKGDASLNFPVELEIRDNKDQRLKAGMYGTAHFGNDEPVHALVVPRGAFVGSISSNQVFVAKDGRAMLTEVVSGRNFGAYVEVVSGIEQGQEVITSGQINLLHETPINIIK